MTPHLLRPGALTLAAFVALTAAAGLGLLEPIEPAITEALQARPSRALDIAGSVYGTAGAAEVTGPLALALAALVWRRNRRRGVALAVTFVAVQALGILLKRYLPHEGPPIEYARPGWFPVPVASGGLQPGYSYPSGHALRLAFIVAIVACLRPPRPVTVAVAIAGTACLLLWAYMGAHWATDVLGGALLGAGAAALVAGLTAGDAGRALLPRWRRQRVATPPVVAGAADGAATVGRSPDSS